jgi:hypothetical protein
MSLDDDDDDNNNNNNNNNNNSNVTIMVLGHFLNHSGLTYPEVSAMVSPNPSAF